MNEIPHWLDLWTFTRFVDKTRFVDGFLGNEKSTNRVMHCIWEFEIRKSIWNFLELGLFIDCDRLIMIKEVLNHYIAFLILKIHFSFLAPNLKFDRFSEENLENLRTEVEFQKKRNVRGWAHHFTITCKKPFGSIIKTRSARVSSVFGYSKKKAT